MSLPYDRRKPQLRFAALGLTATLALASCSSPEGAGDAEALDGIEFSLVNEQPEITINDPIEAEEVSSTVLETGEGETTQSGDLVQLDTALVDPATGEILQQNYGMGGDLLTLSEQFKSQTPEVYDVLVDQQVGSTMAYYIPEGTYNTASTAQLMVITIRDIVPAQATGEPIDQADLDESLPAVTLDDNTGEPTIAEPEGEAPEELIVQPLIQGDGAEVTEESFVTVQYRGIKWSDGEEFDSSWSRGEPTGFSLQEVVAGWREGLAGQAVGSQVMIVVPPEKGYGGTPHELAEETLVFVVDILSSVEPQQQEIEE